MRSFSYLFEVPRWIAALLLCALLAGCAGLLRTPELPPERPARNTVSSFTLEGRVSVTRESERAQANFVWQHSPQSDAIDVFSPVGSQVAKLSASPSGAQLQTADRKRYDASGMDDLSERIFGARLPLEGMPNWVLGRAAAHPDGEKRDAARRLAELSERGWQIHYLEYESDAENALPTLVEMVRDPVRVRLKVDRWNLVE